MSVHGTTAAHPGGSPATAAPTAGTGVGDGSFGERIRAFRKMRRLTLKSVAAHAGVSESFLSQVERGNSGASVSTLKLIAEALGLSLSDLFSESPAPQHRVVTPEERPRILAAGVVKYMLTQRPLKELEVLEGEFEPGATTGGVEYTHGDSQELLYVIDGTVELTLGGETFLLTASCSMEYRSSVAHGLRNVGAETARLLWIISPPSL
jgi:transcriptional regulator with XRE-family HTH domain